MFKLLICSAASCQRYSLAVRRRHINPWTCICLWRHHWQYFSTECWC